jgi:hypothetical protein
LITNQLYKGRELRSLVSSVVQWAAAALALLIAPFYSIRTWASVVDPDIWWHIRTGDWILAHHSVPRFAILSQHLERPWIAYSWLFDVIVSGVEHSFGLVGIPNFLICLQVMLSLTFLLAIQHFARSFWWSWLIGMFAIYSFYVNPLRSLQFSMLFFIVELCLIFDAERKGDDQLLFWTAPLFCLWANFHIQFTYGLSILGLYVGTRIISALEQKGLPGDSRAASLRRLLAILVAAVAGSCIGPNWINPYKVVFYYVIHSGQFQIVQEMLAMNFRRPEHYAELLLLLAACYVLGRSRRRDLFRPALLLVTALISFRSLRDAWFVSIAAGFVLAEAVGQAHSHAAEPRSEGRTRRILQYAMAVAVAFIVSFGLANHQGANTQGLMAVIDRVYPIRATEFVRDSHLPGPMYNSFNWGGFLIFNLGEQPVSIDSRGNAYSDDLIARSVSTINAVGWQEDPDLSRANFALLERSAPLAAALDGDPRFRLAYQDRLAVVYVRAQGH